MTHAVEPLGDADFSEDYYLTGTGHPYRKDDVWLGFFGAIADMIVTDIAPRRVLDVGCALGLLVEQLRERGVEAYGLDISSYAIARVPPVVRPYCWQASVADELMEDYDLIVCQEVLPHVVPDDADAAIANFCRHAPEVLFSSAPVLDRSVRRHVNFSSPEHFAAVFARQDFAPDPTFDATVITPWARRFKRVGAPRSARGTRSATREGAVPLAVFRDACQATGILPPDSRFVHLEIDISNACNLRCRMCYFSLPARAAEPAVYLSPEAFERLTPLFPFAHTVTLSLGAEPLLSPYFVPILERLSQHQVPNISFYTHGMLLCGQLADAVMAHGVTLVVVSVDGATAGTFESIRRGASFARLVRNVAQLTERKRFSGAGRPTVRFNVTMMKSNVHELEGIVELGASLGVEEINFFHLAVYDGLDMDNESLVHHKALSNEHLARALARAAELGVTVTAAPQPFVGESSSRDAQTRAFAPTPYCLYPFYHVSMDAKGQVMPCPFAHGEAPWGRVREDAPIDGIWLNDAFTELRNRILAHDPPDMCRRCTFLASRYPDDPGLFAARAIRVGGD